MLGDLHQVLAWVVVAANAAAGLWALAAHRWEPARHRALWWATGVAYVLIFVQVGVGVALANAEDIEAPELHELYGFASLVGVGIVYSYRTQVPGRHRYLYWAGSSLFLMGMALRASFL